MRASRRFTGWSLRSIGSSGSEAGVLVWLNSPNAELGRAAPIGLVMEGRAGVVADLVEGTLAGVIG